jgi:YfiH family protein
LKPMPERIIIDKKEYYSIEVFNNQNVACAFSTRLGNNMSLEYGETGYSLANRKKFLSGLSIEHHKLVCAKQVHGDRVRVIKGSDAGQGALNHQSALEDTDAFVTNEKELPLAIFTADCLSVFLFDPKAPAVGLVHAGWRSSKEDIILKTIDLMGYKYGSDPLDLHVAFGPSIRECCYQVGKEMQEFFPEHIAQKGEHFYLDLIKFNKRKLLDSGVKEENVFDSGICTSCRNDIFYSYRKEGNRCGRIMSVIMLK